MTPFVVFEYIPAHDGYFIRLDQEIYYQPNGNFRLKELELDLRFLGNPFKEVLLLEHSYKHANRNGRPAYGSKFSHYITKYTRTGELAPLPD
jgi:hypothetical protein